jgi:alkanesulfonate monooxygenase SsuD/methylene tetrahydromethanopterin reductase-like flavin-dependent oxidoreductase (luciferase family)
MRVGLSWNLEGAGSPGDRWQAVLADIERGDALGYDSAWVTEGRGSASACPQPAFLLTRAAPRTRSIQLVVAGRTVGHASAIRIAEEVAVLDLYSRGRAAIALLAGSRQGVPPGHVHELAEFLDLAWTADEFRYHGSFIRFPSDVASPAPSYASEPEPGSAADYVPQWEAGPVQPAFMTITPKPYQRRPAIYAEVDDAQTLEWAARHGISPVVRAAVATEAAIARLAEYRRLADAAGRSPAEVDPILEREIRLDASGDGRVLGGSAGDLIRTIRRLKLEGGFRHLVWNREPRDDGALRQFAAEVQPMLQA